MTEIQRLHSLLHCDWKNRFLLIFDKRCVLCNSLEVFYAYSLKHFLRYIKQKCPCMHRRLFFQALFLFHLSHTGLNNQRHISKSPHLWEKKKKEIQEISGGWAKGSKKRQQSQSQGVPKHFAIAVVNGWTRPPHEGRVEGIEMGWTPRKEDWGRVGLSGAAGKM